MTVTNPIELTIITKLVDGILAAGHRISVFDGEEFALKDSTDKDAIMEQVAISDETTLVLKPIPDGAPGGWIWLIHGNEADVITDMSVQLAEAEFITAAEAIADTYR